MTGIKSSLLPAEEHHQLCIQLAKAIAEKVMEADGTDLDTLIALSEISDSLAVKYVRTNGNSDNDKINAMGIAISEMLEDLSFSATEAVAVSVRLMYSVMRSVQNTVTAGS